MAALGARALTQQLLEAQEAVAEAKEGSRNLVRVSSKGYSKRSILIYSREDNSSFERGSGSICSSLLGRRSR